jgi:hypothetical protein
VYGVWLRPEDEADVPLVVSGVEPRKIGKGMDA